MNIHHKERQKVYDFLDNSDLDHGQVAAYIFRKSIGVSSQKYRTLRVDWAIARKEEKQREKNLSAAKNRFSARLAGGDITDDNEFLPVGRFDNDGNFDIKKAITIHLEEIFEGLRAAARSGNSQAAQILLKVNGNLVEESKRTVTHEFNIKDAVKAVQGARREIDGVGSVYRKTAALLDSVYEAPEPSTDSDH